MIRHGEIFPILLVSVPLSACVSVDWKPLREEFPKVSANCGLRGTLLQRDRSDKRLLRLVFRQRYNARLQASRDGSLDWRRALGAGAGLAGDHRAERGGGVMASIGPSASRAFPAPALLASVLLLGGCFIGDENDWASRRQIIAAAERCGVPDFEPVEAGAAYTAYVPATVPNAAQKEDCIYKDLEAQGLLATR